MPGAASMHCSTSSSPDRTGPPVRRVSRNRDITVIVGGRLFHEHPELASTVGADATFIQATDIQLIAAILFGLAGVLITALSHWLWWSRMSYASWA